ncbi:MAG: PQQ-binding-like beta-propeller repeat protein [Limisphaerales bacterium]
MRRLLFIFLFAFGWMNTLPLQADWPQFRGPAGDGSTRATGLPIQWGEQKNIEWETAIPGRAWSSPVIRGNQIWMTTASENGQELSVICLDFQSGKVLHNKKIFDVEAPQYAHRFNTYGSPTPVIEQGRLYVSWGSPGLACIDTETAEVIWQRRDFVCNHYRGAGSSVYIYGNLLINNFDGSDFQYVVGLDKLTGKTIWRTDRSVDFKDLGPDGKPDREGDWRKAYSTPRVFQVDSRPMLISQGAKAAYAYDPSNGKEIWRVEDHSSHSASTTPISGHGLIFLCTGNPRGELWAVKPDGEGVVNDSHVVWKVKRNVPTRPSLVLSGDLIFMVDDGGIATCLEAKSGKEVWRERIGGNFSASPLLAEGRVYFFNEEGKTVVIEAGREFKVLSENELGNGFMASAAVSGKSLILRSRTHLYRVENASF